MKSQTSALPYWPGKFSVCRPHPRLVIFLLLLLLLLFLFVLLWAYLHAQTGIIPVGVKSLTESSSTLVSLSEKFVRAWNERPYTWIQRWNVRGFIRAVPLRCAQVPLDQQRYFGEPLYLCLTVVSLKAFPRLFQVTGWHPFIASAVKQDVLVVNRY